MSQVAWLRIRRFKRFPPIVFDQVLVIDGSWMARSRRGKAQFHRKDLAIALQLAHAYNVSLPLTAIVDQLFTTLVARQQGRLDHSALLTVIETLSNHQLHLPEEDFMDKR